MCKQQNIQHQNMKQLEPQQKYCLGTNSKCKTIGELKRFYRALTLQPSALALKWSKAKSLKNFSGQRSINMHNKGILPTLFACGTIYSTVNKIVTTKTSIGNIGMRGCIEGVKVSFSEELMVYISVM